MALLVAAKVWHYWLSYALLIPIALVLVGLGVAYVGKVKAQRYPRR